MGNPSRLWFLILLLAYTAGWLFRYSSPIILILFFSDKYIKLSKKSKFKGFYAIEMSSSKKIYKK